jgi:hypothetical protein
VGINENIWLDLILEFLFYQKLYYCYCSMRYLDFLQEESASSFLKMRYYSTNNFKRTRCFQIIFLIHRPTWWNKFFINDSLPVQELTKLIVPLPSTTTITKIWTVQNLKHD